MQAEEGTRMDISVSVPPSDTCSMPEKGQGNYSLFLSPARDSAVIPIGSSHLTAAHENQKEPHPSVGTSSISAAHENQFHRFRFRMKTYEIGFRKDTFRNLIFQLELLLSLLHMKTRRNLIHQSELLPSLCHIVIHVQRLKSEEAISHWICFLL
ncbi:hypothetical protein ISN44_As07g013330 [Arabidopsis suecica]|uniref:Uncharacterized protein n=1 Tax=Arabidopsis suecica TaxID=45249 RepID=A0A8T2BSP8_ARASU|nr:hypothetical protein ISN44_As07g013330 [Arabidopsis suecica]